MTVISYVNITINLNIITNAIFSGRVYISNIWIYEMPISCFSQFAGNVCMSNNILISIGKDVVLDLNIL